MASSARLIASTRTTLPQSHPDSALFKALRLINQVPIEALLGHREEAESALFRLCRLFPAIPGPKASTIQKCQSVLPSVEQTTEVAPAFCQRLPPTQGCQPVSPSVEQTTKFAPAFFQRLQKQEKEIVAFLALSEAKAIGDIPADGSRIDDLVNPARSLEINYRKGLRRRSLALEYERWELVTHRTSKVTDLLCYLELKQIESNENLLQTLDQEQQKEKRKPRRNGYICSYVEDQPGFSDKRAVIKGIRNGIKILAFERLFKKPVVSAVISFAFGEFRDLRLEELPELKETLGNPSWISRILAEKESWYQRCFDKYDCEHLHSSFFPL